MPKPKVQTTEIKQATPEQQGMVGNSVLIRIGFGVLGNSKRAHVGVQTEAKQERFKVHKKLLNSPELEAIKAADMKIRQYVYNECVPFDMGSHVLSYKKLDRVITRLNDYKEIERPELVNELIAAYPAQVKEAEADLGPEFNPAHFPDVKEIRGFFTFDYAIMNFDVPGELKGLNAGLYKAQSEKVSAQILEMTHEIQQAQRLVLHSLVDNLAFKLMPDEEGKKRKLNKTAVTKLQEFLKDFEYDDVTGDKQAQDVIAQLKALTEGVSPETLKDNEELKAKLATSLIGIEDALDSMLDEVPTRKYKDLDEETVEAAA